MAVSSGADIKLRVLIDYDTQGAAPLREVDNGIRSIKNSSSGLSGVLGGMGGLIAEALPAMTIAAAGAAFLSVVDGASKLDKGVREIGTLMGGLTDREIKNMKKELSALSISSGQAIEPLVKARYDIVSSGFTDAADSALILETSARLAVGGVTEVSTAADVLTTVISAYGLKAKDVGKVSDDMFTIVKLGKTTMTELGTQFGVLAAVAAPAGVSVHESGAALAALTVQGQSTSVAVTGISAAIMEMQRPSKAMQTALKSIGVESDNLIKTGGGLKGALDLVSRASEESGISVNKLFTREEALRAVLPLTGVAARAFSDDLLEMEHNAGATDAAFNQMAMSSAFLQDQAWRAFDAVKNSLGDAVINSDLFKGALIFVTDTLLAVGDASGVLSIPVESMSDLTRYADAAWINIKNVGSAIWSVGEWALDAAVKVGQFVDKLSFGLVSSAVKEVGGAISKANDAIVDWQVTTIKTDQTNRMFAASIDRAKDAHAAHTPIIKDNTGEVGKSGIAKGDDAKKIEEHQASLAKHGLGLQDHTGHTKTNSGAVKSHGDSVEEAARKLAAWNIALDDSKAVLSGSSRETVTLAQANDRVATAFAAALASQSLSKEHTKEITAATREYSDALRDQEKLQGDVKKALDDAAKALTLGTEKTLTVAEANKKYDEAVVALTAEIAINENAETANGESKVRLKEKTDAVTEAHKGQRDAIKATADAYDEQTTRIADAVKSIGTAFETATGISIKGLDTLTLAIKEFSATNADGTAKENRTALGVLGIADSVGQFVGGSTGSAISGAASGAATGLSIGGPIGGVIGGVVGLGLSLFSSDSAAKQQRVSDRQGVYEAIVQSALNGGAFSQDLLAQGGYSYTGVAALRDVNPIKTPDGLYHVSDQGNALLNDSRNWDGGAQEITDLATAIAVMDSASKSIAGLMTPTLSTTVEQIMTGFEFAITQVGQLGVLTQAVFADLIVAVTGVTADGVASTISDIFSGFDGYASAGDAFAARMTDAIRISVQNIAIMNLVNDAIMPMLQPALAEITTRLIAGSLTGADMSALIAQIGAATEAISPLVTSLYNAVRDAGALTSDQAGSLTAMGESVTSSVDALNTGVADLGPDVSSISVSAEAMSVGVVDLGSAAVNLSDSAEQIGVATEELGSFMVTSSGELVSAIDATVSTIASMTSINASVESQQAQIITLLETILTVDGDNKVLLGRVMTLLDRVSQGGSSIRTLVVTE
jgi:TP901 family phage tail tape measure protein